jgi:probable phosphoglycerate mutase
MSLPAWPEIFFIRHGETPWNAEKRYQGRRDIPLNDTGRGQALANGVILRDALHRMGRDPAALEWHASPLTRTRDTVERVRQAFDTPLPEVNFDIRLVEISFGELEGYLFHELPANMMASPGSRDESFWEFRPRDGENYRDVEERLNAFAMSLKGPSVIVAHGGIARTLRVLIEKAPIIDVVNWGPPQNVVMHFAPGRPMQMIGG